MKKLIEFILKLFRREKGPVTIIPFPPEKDSTLTFPRTLKPYRWAWGEINQAEIVGIQNNPRIIFYHSFTTLKATNDETPWCSAFMCAAAESTGFPSTKSAAASSWLTYGVPGDGTPGNIAVLSRGDGHHVGFVDQPYKSGDPVIVLLGGNQGNRVCTERFNASRLLALRRFV